MTMSAHMLQPCPRTRAHKCHYLRHSPPPLTHKPVVDALKLRGASSIGVGREIADQSLPALALGCRLLQTHPLLLGAVVPRLAGVVSVGVLTIWDTGLAWSHTPNTHTWDGQGSHTRAVRFG